MAVRTSTLERLLKPAEGDLPADFARKLLALDFSPEDHARYAELAQKAQAGTLSEAEQIDLDDLLTANDVLVILRAKAQVSLNSQPSAA